MKLVFCTQTSLNIRSGVVISVCSVWHLSHGTARGNWVLLYKLYEFLYCHVNSKI